jgi:hypothetical protein
MIVNELVSDLKKWKAAGLIFKIDFHKTSWDYLDDIMGYMGLGKKWRTMIYECLSSSKLLVLINGSPSKEFSVRRGLRKGDPLPLFCLTQLLRASRSSFKGHLVGILSKGCNLHQEFLSAIYNMQMTR